MSKKFAKVDVNQPEIVKELRSKGYSVKHVHEVKNFVDIVVGHKGKNYLFEIKQDKSKKLTPGESKFFESWSGQKDIIYCAQDAIDIINLNSF